MGDLANAGVNEMLDHIFGTGAYTMPTTVAIALLSSADDTSFTEISETSNNYARKLIPAVDWNAAASRQITNANAVTFNTASASWGTPSFWGIFDTATYGAGVMLAWGAITTPTAINNGDTPSFAAGELDISFNAHAANVGIGNIHANEFLDHMFGKSALTVPTIYVGFTTVVMTETSDFTNELAAVGNYTRVNQVGWDAGVSGATENSGNITFSVSGANWTPSALAVFITDISTAGGNANLMYFGKVTTFSAVDGDTVQINTGDLDVVIT